MDACALDPILALYPDLDDGGGPQPARSLPREPVAGGLINLTFAVGARHVLQRLHPIFRAEVNADIAALTPRLREAGVPVPAIVRARDGRPWVENHDPPTAGVWRLLTRLPGHTRHRLGDPCAARAAGAMVARFHTALVGVDHAFAFSRPGAHDTARHVAGVGAALAAHADHRLAAAIAPIAAEISALWSQWGEIPTLPTRIIHGDLKVSNLLFDGDAVVGIIDLDTMAASSVDVELGDALRSWGNASTEDDPTPAFRADLAAAALDGWLAGAAAWVTAAERRALPAAVERICLELAARFATDALAESYFGWDPTRFPTRGDHNLARARNQLGLARDVRRQRAAMRAAVGG